MKSQKAVVICIVLSVVVAPAYAASTRTASSVHELIADAMQEWPGGSAVSTSAHGRATEERTIRELDRLFATRVDPGSEKGDRRAGSFRIEAYSPSFLTDFIDDVASTSRDLDEHHGYYKVAGIGWVDVRSGVMYKPPGKRFWYGIKSVRHATGPAIEWRFVDWHEWFTALGRFIAVGP